jgi:large subunit ribosomal protein L15
MTANMKETGTMQMHDLFPAPGSRKPRKRVGRGHGSGHGGTSGRGSNGQLSRAGGGKGPGFEGGQNPLYMRLPKLPGFKNRFRVEYAVINVSRLEEKFDKGAVVDIDALFGAGLIKSKQVPVKVLGDGELTKALTVKVDKVSGPARAKIEAVGGTVETL